MLRPQIYVPCRRLLRPAWDSQGAISDCYAAVLLDPRNATALATRGDAKRMLKDYKVSLVCFASAAYRSAHVLTFVHATLCWINLCKVTPHIYCTS